MRVVFSMDLMSTLFFGVMGELASFRGLKLRTVLMIRLDVFGRVRIRIERQLSVASTTSASLQSYVSMVVSKRADLICLPAVVLQCPEHPIQEPGRLSFKLPGI